MSKLLLLAQSCAVTHSRDGTCCMHMSPWLHNISLLKPAGSSPGQPAQAAAGGMITLQLLVPQQDLWAIAGIIFFAFCSIVKNNSCHGHCSCVVHDNSGTGAALIALCIRKNFKRTELRPAMAALHAM